MKARQCLALVGVWGVVLCGSAMAVPSYYSANGHWYEVVQVGGPYGGYPDSPDPGINWYDAELAAREMVHNGLHGHLVTVTDSGENSFITQLLAGQGGNYWSGAVQPAGSPEPGGGWEWITGEAWSYTRWKGGEPNNGGGIEDRMHFYGVWDWPRGTWNDGGANGRNHGFVVEWDPYSDPYVPLPEPATMLAGLAGLAGVGRYVRRRKTAAGR